MSKMNNKETKKKHINFIRGARPVSISDGSATNSRNAFREFISPPEGLWLCRNNRSGSVLAKLHYYPQWKQHVAEFAKDAVFSKDCLTDIADFIGELNEANKSSKRNRTAGKVSKANAETNVE